MPHHSESTYLLLIISICIIHVLTHSIACIYKYIGGFGFVIDHVICDQGDRLNTTDSHHHFNTEFHCQYDLMILDDPCLLSASTWQ